MKLPGPILLILFIVSGYSLICQGSDSNTKYRAWISWQRDKKELNVYGNFENSTGKNINIYYKLISEKTGGSGNSSITQKGNVEVKGFENSILSKVELNFQKNDSYFIKLIVFCNNSIISQDSVRYNGL